MTGSANTTADLPARRRLRPDASRDMGCDRAPSMAGRLG